MKQNNGSKLKSNGNSWKEKIKDVLGERKMDFKKSFIKKEVFDLALKSGWNSVHICFECIDEQMNELM